MKTYMKRTLLYIIALVVIVSLCRIGAIHLHRNAERKAEEQAALAKVLDADLSKTDRAITSSPDETLYIANGEVTRISEAIVVYVQSKPHSHTSENNKGFIYLRINDRVFYRDSGECEEGASIHPHDYKADAGLSLQDLLEWLKMLKYSERQGLIGEANGDSL
jgi:hypothetical protein